jgi:hypothetical protein
MPGHCSRVSEDEIELLGLIQAGRSADPSLLDQALLVFARQMEAERLRASVLGLVGLLGMMADAPSAAATADISSRRPLGARLH